MFQGGHRSRSKAAIELPRVHQIQTRCFRPHDGGCARLSASSALLLLLGLYTHSSLEKGSDPGSFAQIIDNPVCPISTRLTCRHHQGADNDSLRPPTLDDFDTLAVNK